MDLSKFETAVLAVYLNKIESHMHNLQEILDTTAKVRSENKFFDADSKIRNATNQKLNDLGAAHNDIHLEIEKRLKVDMNVSFEYEKFTDYDTQVKRAYMPILAKLQAKQLQAEAEANPTKA